jgi:WD40 repeat protein
VNSAVFSPDGTYVLTASHDGTARLFDCASSREIARYQGKGDAVTSAAFSPDDTCVLTASDDGTARLFDRASSREIARYQGHENWLTSAVFSPDGTCVLTASFDRTARLFDRASSREIARYRDHRDAVSSAVFSPDGTCVLTASRDGTARLFDRASARCLRQLVLFLDDYAVCDPDGTVLSTGPNGWKYIHALAPVPGGLPKVLCPDHMPIHVPVDLLGPSPTHMAKAKRRAAPRSPHR